MSSFLSSLFATGSPTCPPKAKLQVRPALEHLEERALMDAKVLNAVGGIQFRLNYVDSSSQYISNKIATNLQIVGTGQDDVVRVSSKPLFGGKLNDLLISVKTGSLPAKTYSLRENFGMTLGASNDLGIDFYGQDGADTFVNNTAYRTSAYGGKGNDYLEGGYGSNYLYGEGDKDFLVSKLNGVNFNMLDGGSEDDTIQGGDGRDTIYGGSGRDTIYGYGGKDVILGEGGNDIIYGGADNDTILGGEGDDQLYGGAGLDTLYGEEGKDYLDGGLDDFEDILEGGSEADTFVGRNGKTPDWINDLSPSEGDVIVIGSNKLSLTKAPTPENTGSQTNGAFTTAATTKGLASQGLAAVQSPVIVAAPIKENVALATTATALKTQPATSLTLAAQTTIAPALTKSVSLTATTSSASMWRF